MSCLRCLKYTMCVVNFVFFICGTAIFGLGIYLLTTTRFSSLMPSLPAFNFASTLFILGIIITCISFLGFLGSLKENRCLLISFFILLFVLMLAELTAACLLLKYETQIDTFVSDDLRTSLQKSKSLRDAHNDTIDDWDKVQTALQCCGVMKSGDWQNIPKSCECEGLCNGTYWPEGCYAKLTGIFENNLLNTGVGIIVVCVIEVLGMCFSMTLFCHISRSGLGYK